MKKLLIFLIIVLAITVEVLVRQKANALKKWEIAEANVKAYDAMLGESNKHNAAYQLTIEQMKYFQDSILKEMNEVRKNLKIKEKNVQSYHYITSGFSKTDTLMLSDTIFKEPTLAMDTTIGDEWYKVQVGLKYPSRISVKPEFKSEKYVVVSTKRETVNPPKKFFLWRWLQRKHTILNVDVVEKNPYVQNESSKFVKIVK